MLSSRPLVPAAPPPPPFLPAIAAASSAFSASSLASSPAPSFTPPRPQCSVELRCEVALDPPELLHCTDSWLDGIRLKGETVSKAFLDLNAPTGRNSVECVQCVEPSYSDTMHHCVPEWDVSGGDLDAVLEPTDLFAPSKGRWEFGQSRKCNASDTFSVPDYDFEELCWEDGQLVVVMQGLTTRGIRNKNCFTRTSDHLALPSESCTTTGLTAGDVDGTLDKVVNGGLIDSFAANSCGPEDGLLSWLQHPMDDTPEKYGSDVPSGSPNSNLWNVCEKVYVRDSMNQGVPLNTLNSGHSCTISASSASKLDVLLNHTSQITVGEAFKHVDGALFGGGLKGSNITTNVSTSSRQSLECGPKLRRPPLEVQHLIAGSAGASSVEAGTPRSRLNFSNFSRPAASIKANLRSIGIASGPTGTERLKQLDRVAADACNCESNSATDDAILTAAKGQGDALVGASSIPNSMGASSVHNSVQSLWSREEVDPAMSAVDAVDGNFKVVDISHGWNSCVTSSVGPGIDRTMEPVEAAEPAVPCCSGGSGNTAGKSGKDAVGGGKRKMHNIDDSECQSKDSEDESADGKKTSERFSSLKRSRAAEIHNQSERRRRDRIKEKMKALQELIPNCNKQTDKASLLEEAIEYVKTLQTQVQMMSYRSGMSLCPLLIPQGMQHLQLAQLASFPHMHMGMGMVDMSVAMPRRHILPMPPLSTTPFTCPMMPAVSGSSIPPPIPASALPMSEVSWMTVSPPGHQVLLPARPAPIPGTHELSHTPNMISQNIYLVPQRNHSQVMNKSTYDTLLAYQHQIPQPSNFIMGNRPLQ